VLALEPGAEVVEQVGDPIAERLLPDLPEALDELLAGIVEDLAEAVVGVEDAELLVRGPLVGRRRLAGGALGSLAGEAGLLAQLALELGQALLDV
jgi:hypothetical protein